MISRSCQRAPRWNGRVNSWRAALTCPFRWVAVKRLRLPGQGDPPHTLPREGRAKARGGATAVQRLREGKRRANEGGRQPVFGSAIGRRFFQEHGPPVREHAPLTFHPMIPGAQIALRMGQSQFGILLLPGKPGIKNDRIPNTAPPIARPVQETRGPFRAT